MSHSGSAWPRGSTAWRKRCTRPSKFVYVPSRSTHAAAGRTQWARSLVALALVPVKIRSGSARSAASVSASGQAPARRSWPKTQRHFTCRARAAAERAGDRADRLLPRGVAHRAVLTPRRRHEPRLVVHEREPIAAGVTDPPAVDVRVEARLEARHAAPLVVVRAPAVHVHLDVAAARAARTDGLRAVQVPDAHREAEVAVGEGAHRADVYDVAGVLVGELRPREEPDLRVIAAVEDAELTRARDLVAKPHAARAEDAPLRVQHDVRAEGHRLRLVHLLVSHARVVEAMLHVVDL